MGIVREEYNAQYKRKKKIRKHTRENKRFKIQSEKIHEIQNINEIQKTIKIQVTNKIQEINEIQETKENQNAKLQCPPNATKIVPKSRK